MKIHAYDSRKRLFTKTVTIDLTVAGVTAAATTLLFRPPVDTVWAIKAICSYNREVAGTVSDAPNITIDNGTDASNFVAAVDLATTDNAFKQYTMASTTLVVDHDHPLRLKSGDGADGATSFLVDFTIEMLQVMPHYS